MSQQVNIQQAKGCLSQLVAAAEGGDQVIIARRGQPIVKLIPVTQAERRQLGFMPGIVTDAAAEPLSDDDAELWQ
ncbi:MAG: type II toxin-antitoxin system prevent-host-death family antitoxin [Propionibacteriaceae bacterium]|jgi:prevent-host-death family protein|nr:type II toxin-antitoxin system prevent-host-death family antitoxin [Propionibacteriaceae bacterium]